MTTDFLEKTGQLSILGDEMNGGEASQNLMKTFGEGESPEMGWVQLF